MIELMAVDVNKAPRHIKEELEAMSNSINSPSDLNRLTDEAKHWVESNSETNEIKNTFMKNIEKELIMMDIKTLGIRMLHHLIGKEAAEDINRRTYNKCTEFVREYNTYEAEGKDAQAAAEKE